MLIHVLIHFVGRHSVPLLSSHVLDYYLWSYVRNPKLFVFAKVLISSHNTWGNNIDFRSECLILKGQSYMSLPSASEQKSVSLDHLRLVAMSCRHHPLAADEGAPTEVVARVQGHLVGHRVCCAGVAPDDLVIVIIAAGGESDWWRNFREVFVKWIHLLIFITPFYLFIFFDQPERYKVFFSHSSSKGHLKVILGKPIVT